MKTFPLLEIDLDKIQANTAAVVGFCAAHGIAVAGVVKGVCGSPKVAQAMLAGGVKQIGDSRIANLARLRDNGINSSLLMLRIPMLSQVPEVVSLCDASLNSELKVIEALGQEADRLKRCHGIILMIDLGDLREGVMPSDAPYLAERIMEIPGVSLKGIGTNLTCYGGVAPSVENLGVLAETGAVIEKRIGRKLEIISGGNSSSLPLIMSGGIPSGINHIRIGEGILLGQETLHCDAIPGTVRDSFLFKAEVIEAGRKPSAPIGEIVRDAFGGTPFFEDRGIRRRAILGAGRQDISIEGLKPLLSGALILGASSDHLLVDVEDCKDLVKTGDVMSFRLEYSALLSAMTSEYVCKDYVRKRPDAVIRSVTLINAPVSAGANMPGAEMAPAALRRQKLAEKLSDWGYESATPSGTVAVEVFDTAAEFDVKCRIVANSNLALAGVVAESLRKGAFPLVLGGDRTVTIGALRGVRLSGRSNIGLIAFGAFADFNTPETSETKNLHGLTISACAGQEEWCECECVEQENIIIICLRQVDKREGQLLRNSRLQVFSMEQIDLLGMREVICQAVERLAHCSDGIHVSLSMDAVSPEYAPGVSTPVEGGISLREAHLAMEVLSRSHLPVSMDVVELNPVNDTGDKTARMAVDLIGSLLGKRII